MVPAILFSGGVAETRKYHFRLAVANTDSDQPDLEGLLTPTDRDVFHQLCRKLGYKNRGQVIGIDVVAIACELQLDSSTATTTVVRSLSRLAASKLTVTAKDGSRSFSGMLLEDFDWQGSSLDDDFGNCYVRVDGQIFDLLNLK